MSDKKNRDKKDDKTSDEDKKFKKKVAKGIKRICKEPEDIRAAICKELIKIQKMTPEQLQKYNEESGNESEA